MLTGTLHDPHVYAAFAFRFERSSCLKLLAGLLNGGDLTFEWRLLCMIHIHTHIVSHVCHRAVFCSSHHEQLTRTALLLEKLDFWAGRLLNGGGRSIQEKKRSVCFSGEY